MYFQKDSAPNGWLSRALASSGVQNGRSSSRMPISGGLLFGRRWAEDVGAEVVAADAEFALDNPGIFGRYRAPTLCPLPDHCRSCVYSSGKPSLAAFLFRKLLDDGCAHGAKIALLTTNVNSFANRSRRAVGIASLYA